MVSGYMPSTVTFAEVSFNSPAALNARSPDSSTVNRNDPPSAAVHTPRCDTAADGVPVNSSGSARSARSEEHTSELQSRENLVCRLLLEKKKITIDFQLYL